MEWGMTLYGMGTLLPCYYALYIVRNGWGRVISMQISNIMEMSQDTYMYVCVFKL